MAQVSSFGQGQAPVFLFTQGRLPKEDSMEDRREMIQARGDGKTYGHAQAARWQQGIRISLTPACGDLGFGILADQIDYDGLMCAEMERIEAPPSDSERPSQPSCGFSSDTLLAHSDTLLQCHYLAEPSLSFAGKQQCEDPRTGLTAYGPDSKSEASRHQQIRLGIVGR